MPHKGVHDLGRDERPPRDLPGPTRPDRISIWPVDPAASSPGGSDAVGFGVDVLYHGVTGFKRADTVHRQLEAAGVPAQLRQELGDAWLVRFGPVTREEMLLVLGGVVW